MKNLKIDLGKFDEISIEKLAHQVQQLFIAEVSFDSVFDENSYLYHQNEALRFVLNHKNRNSLCDALGVSWIYKKIKYPELYINDIEVFSDILKNNIKSAHELSAYQCRKYNLKERITSKEFLKHFMRNTHINSKEKLNAAITLLQVTDDIPLFLKRMPEPFYRYQFNDDFAGFIHICYKQGSRINIFQSTEGIKKHLEKVNFPYVGTPVLPINCKLIKNEAELKRLSYDMNHNLLIHYEKMVNRRAFIFYLDGKFPTVFIVENFQGSNYYQISIAYGMDYTNVRQKEMETMNELLNMYENKTFFMANKPEEMLPEHKRELDALLNIL